MVTESLDAVKIEINKTCGCGEFHQYLPLDATLKSGIYWFQCNGRFGLCHSTLTHITEIAQKRLDVELERQKKERVKEEMKRQNDWVKRNYAILPQTKHKPDEV